MSVFRKRNELLFTVLENEGAEAILVSKKENIRYLSGFRGDDTFLLVLPAGSILISDSRYEEELKVVAQQNGLFLVMRSREYSLAQIVRDHLKKANIKTLAFEADDVSFAFYARLKQRLRGIKLLPLPSCVESLRLFKSDDEIFLMKKALRISEKSLRQIQPLFEERSVTEKYLADTLEYYMLQNGASGIAFPSIVASGAHAALPHAVSRNKKIGTSGPLLIDFGAKFEGYCADLTRTFFLGRMTARFKELYSLVRDAQALAIDFIKAGEKIGDADMLVRDFFTRHGVAQYFTHALGHGLGLEVHEQPSLYHSCEDVFCENMVVTVEPGLYIPGWGGIRIEDDVLVTKKGCERLSKIKR